MAGHVRLEGDQVGLFKVRGAVRTIVTAFKDWLLVDGRSLLGTTEVGWNALRFRLRAVLDRRGTRRAVQSQDVCQTVSRERVLLQSR